jgi:D-apionolactonase
MMQNLKTRFFELKYENSAIRWIKNNGVEIVRMIYSAVRDHNWGTIEPEIIAEIITDNETGFQVKTRVKYKKNDIHFESEYTITGYENRLELEMNGEAKSTFKTNRIGFCVLHPIKECAGKTCTVIHPQKTSVKAVFPKQISPAQPMKNISSLEWEPAKNIFAKLHFSGDVFEMEDQRNWSDASYKTYCRPLSLPFPFEIKKGEKIHQKIVMELECEPQNESTEDFISLKIDENRKFKIPEIGVCSTSRPEKLTKNEAETLKQFSFDHLRDEIHLFKTEWKTQLAKSIAESNLLEMPLYLVILKQFSFDHLRDEIHLFKTEWKTQLAKSIAESNLLEMPLYLVIYFSENFFAEMENLKKSVKRVPVNVKYILIVGKNHLPDDDLFEKVYPEIKAIFPAAKIGAGVNAYFAELNRNRPYSAQAEFINFAVCPQVHAFDDVSLIENLEAQKHVVESAKNLFPEKQIFVSPVTLKQRFNVVATSDEPDVETVELPSQVDVRENSVFAAQWLLGSLKYLAQSGIDLVTYFEIVGWRGFIQGDFESPVPEKFDSKKGDIFPVFYLLKEIAGFNEVIYSESISPLEVDGIVIAGINLNGQPVKKLILANFSNQPKKVKVSGIETAPEGNNLFTSYQIKKENGLFEITENQIVTITVL